MTDSLRVLIETEISELKGRDIVVMDVSDLTDVMDTLIIATGTSNRHVKSIASSVVESAKKIGLPPIGVEGVNAGEWVLVDFGDIVVHLMLQATRDFYEIEKLWSMEPPTRKADEE